MTARNIAEIIDLDLYPIDRPNSPEAAALMARGKAALEERALFSLAGFIRPEMIAPMARELEDTVPRAVRYDGMRLAYVEADPALPETHPRNQRHLSRYHQVLNYQIANDSPLRQVFYWQPLTDFLGELCGYETFFRSDCPHLALSAKIAGAGDTDGWHYDSNDVVFSILLQVPEAGGAFEYAPYIRSETQENYEGVAALVADPVTHAVRPAMALGNLTVFKGDLSFHRVTPVEGNRRRIVALFCYDRHPGKSFSQTYIRELHAQMPAGAGVF